MTVGATHISQARDGLHIAVIASTWDAAHEQLEQAAELAGDDASVSRTRPSLTIQYEDGGDIRFISAGAENIENGQEFDLVIIGAEALSEEIVERYAPTVQVTGGSIVVDGQTLDAELDEAGTFLVCAECGAQLADNNPGATIRHEADGAHYYQQ